jgi:hypothetical protein
VTGDPVVDGARRHAEEFGQHVVGGAEQAVIVRQLAEIRGIVGGTAHGAQIAILKIISKNFSEDL